MAGRYKSIWACLHRCLKIADREDGGLAGFVGGALGGAALLAAHRRLVVLVGVVCGVAGDGVEQGFQFRDTGPQPPDFGDFSAQPREFAIALLATLDVATQLLAEPLDLLAGLPVAGVLCQGLDGAPQRRNAAPQHPAAHPSPLRCSGARGPPAGVGIDNPS